MKAVVYDKRNSPQVLKFCEVERPIPQDNEVLVKIYASSVNAADYRTLRMGIIPRRKIFGADIAGKVEAAGKDVKKFRVGDEVLGDITGCGFGGFAEYVAVPEDVLALKPSAVSFEDAAAVPLAGVTALQALRNEGNIQPGQSLLIFGAGGGVGTYAIQLGRYFGAHVTAVCSANNAGVARSLGAEQVIDYTKEDFARNGKHYDLILALNGNRSLSDFKRALAPKGIFVMVGGALSQVFKSMFFGALMSTGGKKMRYLAAKPDSEDLDWLIKRVEEGKVKPFIEKRYPLQQTADAMQYVGQGHARGKVVISIVQA
jgi:NADPH:quinone reductase-like Zn-dependent oxidoreductase